MSSELERLRAALSQAEREIATLRERYEIEAETQADRLREAWADLLDLSMMIRRLVNALDDDRCQPLREQAMGLLKSRGLTGSPMRMLAREGERL